MSDYVFVHAGQAYTPNGTAVDAADAATHNAAIEARELAQWADKPDAQLAYYAFPSLMHPRLWRASFTPDMTNASVSTWQGKPLGRVTSAYVYQHNFGARMVAIRVQGNNGADYYGRASWDNGECIILRRVKGAK